MGHCPFCKGAIQVDLLVNGGTCPHCLIEIPGEEAPTDPGEQALVRQQQEAAVASGGKGPLIGAAVAVLLLVGAGGGWYAWSSAQEQKIEAAAAGEWTVISLDEHQNQFDEEGEEAQARGSSGSSGSRGGSASAATPSTGGQLASGSSSSVSRSGLNPGGSYSEQVAMTDPTAGATVAVPTSASSTSLSSPGGLSGPSISVGSKNAQEVISDPNAIADMIKRAASRQGRQLEDCYEDRLKIDDSLQGRWSVSFVVTEAGKTKDIGITALNGADAALESCMKQRIARWRFSAIAHDQPIQKTYTFRR